MTAPVVSSAETPPDATVPVAVSEDRPSAEAAPEQQAKTEPVLAVPAPTEDTPLLPETTAAEPSPAPAKSAPSEMQPAMTMEPETALPTEETPAPEVPVDTVAASVPTAPVPPVASTAPQAEYGFTAADDHTPLRQDEAAQVPEAQSIDTSKVVVSTHQARRRAGPILFFVLFLIFALLLIALVLLFLSGSLSLTL